MTVAAAAATRGCDVVLLEKASEVLPLFRGNHSRWLHPHIYDWPEEQRGRPSGLAPDDAGLPLLSWTAATTGEVARQLREAWEALPSRPRIRVIPHVKSVHLGARQGQRRSVSWNARGFKPGGEFDAMVLAVGFGLEHAEEGIDWRSYWDDDPLHQEVRNGRGHHLISGCGDGGLVDLLRVRLRDFRHERVVPDFLGSPSLSEVKQELLRIEQEAYDALSQQGEAASRALLLSRYLKLRVPDDFDATFKQRLRTDTSAVLNGLEEAPLSLHANILNRFLVSRLLVNDLEYRPGPFQHSKRPDGTHEVRFGSGPARHFHRIVCRWGPAPSALEEGFPDIWKKCEQLRSRNALDQTRWPLWPEGYFGSERGPGGGGSGGGATGGGAKHPPAAPFIGVRSEPLGSGYKGREEELQRLHALLAGSESVVLTAARVGNVFAHGGGGIGKSRLAIEYAWRHRSDYPGGIFFAVVKEHAPLTVWADFARELFQEELPRDDEAAVRFARWLADARPGRRLIILDDVQATSPAELTERFSRRDEAGQRVWPPAEGHVSVLVTTRMRDFPGAHGVEVRQLDANAALELLLERARRSSLSGSEREAAADLAARVLGGHPLALTLAGAYMGRFGLSFSEYMESVGRSGLTEKLEAAAGEIGYKVEDHERSIVATYELSREQLEVEDPVNALAWRVLKTAAFLAPNVPIDRKLLLRLLAGQGEAVEAEELGRALARLVEDLSLLDGAREQEEWTSDVVIHPLVADYTRWSMKEEETEEEREQLQTALVGAMSGLFPEYLDFWRVLKPGGDAGWEWLSPARMTHATELCRSSQGSSTRESWFLATDMGHLHEFRADLKRAEEFHLSALSIAQRLAQSDPGHAQWQRDLSVSLNKVGDVRVAMGQLPAALQAFEQSLSIAQRLAQSDPSNITWQTDFVRSVLGVARLLALGTRDNRSRGRLLLERARSIVARLSEESRLTHEQMRSMVPSFEEALLIFKPGLLGFLLRMLIKLTLLLKSRR